MTFTELKQINATKPMSDYEISMMLEKARRLSETYSGTIYVYYYDDADYNVYQVLIEKGRNWEAEQMGFSFIGSYEDGDFTKA